MGEICRDFSGNFPPPLCMGKKRGKTLSTSSSLFPAGKVSIASRKFGEMERCALYDLMWLCMPAMLAFWFLSSHACLPSARIFFCLAMRAYTMHCLHFFSSYLSMQAFHCLNFGPCLALHAYHCLHFGSYLLMHAHLCLHLCTLLEKQSKFPRYNI